MFEEEKNVTINITDSYRVKYSSFRIDKKKESEYLFSTSSPRSHPAETFGNWHGPFPQRLCVQSGQLLWRCKCHGCHQRDSKSKGQTEGHSPGSELPVRGKASPASLQTQIINTSITGPFLRWGRLSPGVGWRPPTQATQLAMALSHR